MEAIDIQYTEMDGFYQSVFDSELSDEWKESGIGKIPFIKNLPLKMRMKSVQWSNEFETIKSIDELSKKAIEVIGLNGLLRFQKFKRYEKGWDFGVGEPLSLQSVAIMETFMELNLDFCEKEPSIFLTREGNLQLVWETHQNEKIEIEFFPNKVEYYIQSTDEEGEILFYSDAINENLSSLIIKLQCS